MEIIAKFPPLKEDHPALKLKCAVCLLPFILGDETAAIPTVPADDEELEKMKAGRPYTSEAVLAHCSCAQRLG